MENTFLYLHTRQGKFKLPNIKEITECWIDHFCESVYQDSKKIFIQLDPDEYLHLNNLIIENQNKYDFILTFEPEILEKCSNAILFEYGTAWVKPEEYTFPEKEFSISFVCNSKYHNSGHHLRHQIYNNQDKIKLPLNFYVSSINPDKNDYFYVQKKVENHWNNPILGKDKYSLFNSMFSIIIENVKKDFYFSEKLIDCFLCKSVPIFWGCPNISNYFNVEGMIIIDNYEDFIEKTSNLSLDFYKNKPEVIEENYNKALNWIDYPDRIVKKINELL